MTLPGYSATVPPSEKAGRAVVQTLDVTQLRAELVDAFEWNEEDCARAVMSQLAAQPIQARVVLDEMLASEDASVRRAAAFGLGELGNPASVKRLEQQMMTEEAREDHDGESVLEVITQVLGRIKAADTRTSLIRRLNRLASGKVPTSGASALAYVLWRKRHPDLIPIVRGALERIPEEDTWALRALLQLLETSPEALATWASDMSVAPDLKANVLAILDEEVPEEFLSVFPAFISAANALGDLPLQKGEASEYCDRLFITLLLHREQTLPALPVTARSELRALARRCLASISLNCSSRAARVLEYAWRSRGCTAD